VDKCVNCQFYDRHATRHSESAGVQWGQCRRGAPRLQPVNAKSHMIEGVWPHVRDDDWCGELKPAVRRVEPRIADVASSAHMAGHGSQIPMQARAPALETYVNGGGGATVTSLPSFAMSASPGD
jgi:hypothetical protein